MGLQGGRFLSLKCGVLQQHSQDAGFAEFLHCPGPGGVPYQPVHEHEEVLQDTAGLRAQGTPPVGQHVRRTRIVLLCLRHPLIWIVMMGSGMQAGRTGGQDLPTKPQQQPRTVTLEDAREAARAVLLPSEASGTILLWKIDSILMGSCFFWFPPQPQTVMVMTVKRKKLLLLLLTACLKRTAAHASACGLKCLEAYKFAEHHSKARYVCILWGV